MIELDIELPLGPRSLRVEATLSGAVTALMGPSGAGKTSLLEAIAGLRPRARGRIVAGDTTLLDSHEGVCLPPEARRVGYVPQDAGLFPHLDVRDNLAFGVRDRRDRDVVASAAEALGIGSLLGRAPSSLSGGERQRVALARALASSPRLLLLDEPLAGVDPGLRERIIPYLLRVQAQWGIPLVYVTHNVGEAIALGGEVLTLDQGRVAAQGDPLELLATPTLSREAEAGLENLLEGRVTSHDEVGGVTRVRLDDGLEVAIMLAAEVAVGERLLLAIRAEDVLVASADVEHVSARNVYGARLDALQPSGTDVTLSCTPVRGARPWLVRLTRSAVSELKLAPGARVWLAAKSHSIRVVGVRSGTWPANGKT